MQKYNATIISTTGAPGTGKSYSRCARFLYDVWLPEDGGVHWSNFPVNFEAFEKKFPYVRERVKIIPAEELAEWAKGEGRGPWDFFTGDMLRDSHVAIDECHLYVKRKGKGCQINAERWSKWLGDIRHHHCSVEFLSQDPLKVNGCIEYHSTMRIQLVNSEDRRDPLFNILLGDWYELRASLGREYETVIWQTEERRILSKWKHAGMNRFTLDPLYFPLYNSYNNTQAKTTEEAEAPPPAKLREFQKRSIPGLWFWFARRNAWRLFSRAACACLVFWLCFMGGFTRSFAFANGILQSMAASNRMGGSTGISAPGDKKAEVPATAVPSPAPGKVLSARDSAGFARAPIAPVVAADAVPVAAPVAVRSETMQHKSLENPPSGEVQQAQLPRVLWLGLDGVALDDGSMVAVGGEVGGFRLVSVDFKKRVALFEGFVDENLGSSLRVPVGGPVGVRVHPKKADDKPGIGSTLPTIVPRS